MNNMIKIGAVANLRNIRLKITTDYEKLIY